jgi:hypothetical protein
MEVQPRPSRKLGHRHAPRGTRASIAREMAARDHFRALHRRPVSLSATLRDARASWQAEARVVDLALGGACVELSAPPAVPARGDAVRLQVRAPNLWDPLDLSARVSWSGAGRDGGSQRMGLQFEHRDGTMLRALVELLATSGYD